MHKKRIALFLSLFFILSISIPSVILVLDASIDISILNSLNDEAENDSVQDLTDAFLLQSNEIIGIFILNNQGFFKYRFKNYPIPHGNLQYPPPEQITL